MCVCVCVCVCRSCFFFISKSFFFLRERNVTFFFTLALYVSLNRIGREPRGAFLWWSGRPKFSSIFLCVFFFLHILFLGRISMRQRLLRLKAMNDERKKKRISEKKGTTHTNWFIAVKTEGAALFWKKKKEFQKEEMTRFRYEIRVKEKERNEVVERPS